MTKYAVHVFCDECGAVHPMGIVIELADGPTERVAVGDVYAGRELPPQLMTMTNNFVTCPATGRLTRQRDNRQVFIVPME